MTEFEKRLKELKLSKNLSQKDLGEQIGTTYSAISYWENGVNEPKICHIIALCNYFNVTADYLLGLID